MDIPCWRVEFPSFCPRYCRHALSPLLSSRAQDLPEKKEKDANSSAVRTLTGSQALLETKDANSSADPTLADSQSLLSLCPPPVYLFLTQSSVRKFYYSTVNAYPGVSSSLTFLSEITPEFRNNNAFGQFDGFNKQRFILLTSFLNKPALYCFSFELPLLLYTSHPEAEREGETHLTEHDLAVISCT